MPQQVEQEPHFEEPERGFFRELMSQFGFEPTPTMQETALQIKDILDQMDEGYMDEDAALEAATPLRQQYIDEANGIMEAATHEPEKQFGIHVAIAMVRWNTGMCRNAYESLFDQNEGIFSSDQKNTFFTPEIRGLANGLKRWMRPEDPEGTQLRE